MSEQSAPIRQLIFASAVVFSCLALGTMLLAPKYRLISLTLLVIVFCAVSGWLAAR